MASSNGDYAGRRNRAASTSRKRRRFSRVMLARQQAICKRHQSHRQAAAQPVALSIPKCRRQEQAALASSSGVVVDGLRVLY